MNCNSRQNRSTSSGSSSSSSFLLSRVSTSAEKVAVSRALGGALSCSMLINSICSIALRVVGHTWPGAVSWVGPAHRASVRACVPHGGLGRSHVMVRDVFDLVFDHKSLLLFVIFCVVRCILCVYVRAYVCTLFYPFLMHHSCVYR